MCVAAAGRLQMVQHDVPLEIRLFKPYRFPWRQATRTDRVRAVCVCERVVAFCVHYALLSTFRNSACFLVRVRSVACIPAHSTHICISSTHALSFCHVCEELLPFAHTHSHTNTHTPTHTFLSVDNTCALSWHAQILSASFVCTCTRRISGWTRKRSSNRGLCHLATLIFSLGMYSSLYLCYK